MSAPMASSNAGGEDVESEEGTLQLAVPRVSKLEDVAFSKRVQMKGHQWRIMVVHREVNSGTSLNSKGADGKKDVLGAYIQHVGPKIQQASWSVIVNASITLVNQTDTDKSYTKDFRHQYTQVSTDWGYSNFLRWKEVMNPAKGFVKNDSILLCARLVYVGPEDLLAPSSSSSSQLQNTSSSLSQSPASSPIAQSAPASRVATSSRVHQHPLSVSGSQPQSSFSQVSSQDLSEETRTLTPTSTSVLLPEMTTFLSCPHCNEQFEEEGQRSPNTLHCGHTFCLGCLEKLVVKEEESNSQQLTCPTCSKQHALNTRDTASGPWWFPNHSMIQLLATVRSRAKHFCPTHQHDCNYYCLDDRVLVCIYCAYHGDHSGHRCQMVAEARETLREELRPLRLQARGRVTELERRLQLMREEREAGKLQVQGCLRQVEEYFSGLEATLHRQRDLLLEEYRSLTGSLNNSMEAQIRDLERRHGNVRHSLEEYERWKTLSPREALSSVSSLTQALEATARTSLPRYSQQPAGARSRRLYIDLPLANPLSSLGPMGHVTVTCHSPSPSPTVEQEVLATVTNGEVDRSHHDPYKTPEGGDSGRETTVDDSLVIDTQEGENPVRGDLVKRTISEISPDTDSELQSKKRRT